MQATVISLSFGNPRPSTLVIVLICLLRLFQMVGFCDEQDQCTWLACQRMSVSTLQFFHYSTNPLFLLRNGDDAATQREQASFLASVRLLWVSRSPEMFLVSDARVVCRSTLSFRGSCLV